MALFMSSRNLSSRGGDGAVVVDVYLIFVQSEHLHIERTLGLADMIVLNKTRTKVMGALNGDSLSLGRE